MKYGILLIYNKFTHDKKKPRTEKLYLCFLHKMTLKKKQFETNYIYPSITRFFK